MPAPSQFNPATGMAVHAAAVADPAGGATQDANSRAATVAILSVLRAAGVIAGATQNPLSHSFNGPTFQTTLAAAIGNPAAGGTTDAELRTGIVALLTAMRNAGWIAGGADPSITPLTFDEDSYNWANAAAIANVAGGATVDTECRAAINAALAACRLRGLIAAD